VESHAPIGASGISINHQDKGETDMGDIVEFGDKKLDDDIDELLEDLLKKAENTGNSDDGKTDEPETAGEKDNLIHLQKKSWPPIDWHEVEAIRKTEYPRIPKKAVTVIQKMFADPGTDTYFEIQDFEDSYPPDPIPLTPTHGDACWMIDLLDRFGGEVRYGNQPCIVKRKKKKPALFLVQPISLSTREALVNVMGLEFEHFLQSKSWTVIGKEVTDKLMVLIVTNRQDEDRIYVGFFDRKTAWVLFRRMDNISIERVLGL
jgi:hypothetical protein